ncbi:MAG: hypothetical protein ABII09_03005 [Planctomycetota bacterium]
MTFDELQKTWQKDAASSKLTIDSELLIREVKRNKEAFESSIFWRDFREVAVAVVMVCVFLHGAFNRAENMWIAGSYVILAMTCLYVAAFFIVDHHLQRKKEPGHTESMLACVESSLTQVEHQIWLLKNVFWLYLLPLGAGIALFFIVVGWSLFKTLPAARVLSVCLVSMLLVVLVFWGVYRLNQHAVRKELIPRKQELEMLLINLANGNKVT